MRSGILLLPMENRVSERVGLLEADTLKNGAPGTTGRLMKTWKKGVDRRGCGSRPVRHYWRNRIQQPQEPCGGANR